MMISPKRERRLWRYCRELRWSKRRTAMMPVEACVPMDAKLRTVCGLEREASLGRLLRLSSRRLLCLPLVHMFAMTQPSSIVSSAAIPLRLEMHLMLRFRNAFDATTLTGLATQAGLMTNIPLDRVSFTVIPVPASIFCACCALRP